MIGKNTRQRKDKKKMETKELQFIVTPLLNWYQENARILPWRKNTEAYCIWVSEIMLQQTRVETVIPYYERFMQHFPTIQALAEGSEEELLKLWEGLGYYSRAKNMQKAAKVICEEYQGQFPEDFKKILSLPGVGAYTAGAISSIAFGKQRAAVDGNVLRVITRLTESSQDILDTKFRKIVTEALEKIYPVQRSGDFTQSLMELGAVICVPNGFPKCEACPLNHLCGAYCHQTQMQYPVKKKKAERKIQHKTVLILKYQDKVALHKRPQRGLLGGMWEFPNLEGKMSKKEIKEWLTSQGIVAENIVKADDNKHIFTHVEWHMSSFLVNCAEISQNQGNAYLWVTKETLEKEYALPTAFKKLWR